MVTDSALLLHLQTEVLEAVARGETIASIAELLCRRAEAMAPGAICSLQRLLIFPLGHKPARAAPLPTPNSR